MRIPNPARCVLTFHRIVDVLERDHDLSWPSLFRVLDTIRDNVTTELSLQPNSGRSIVLTFDDGSTDHAKVGQALVDRQLSGIFFVPAGRVASQGFMTADQLRELSAAGHVIGSHGLNNVRFDGLTPIALRREVRESRARLQQIVGAAITYLAPPGGSEHPLLQHELEENGFSAARSVRWGIHGSEADRWRIPCIPVTELTISRGWVERVLTAWQLPPSMRILWTAKELIPPDARAAVRAWSHRAAGH